MTFFIFTSTYVQRRQNYYITKYEATEIPAANIPKLDLLYVSYCVSDGQMSSTSDCLSGFGNRSSSLHYVLLLVFEISDDVQSSNVRSLE
jgi:hypothetical protein